MLSHQSPFLRHASPPLLAERGVAAGRLAVAGDVGIRTGQGKNHALILVTLLLGSCTSYRYDFNAPDQSLASRGRHNITMVVIESEEGKRLATYELRAKGESRVFRLTDFSPAQYACTFSCEFQFVPGKRYRLSAYPSGDRNHLPIIVQVNQSGAIVEVLH